jgi:hypothetical protein
MAEPESKQTIARRANLAKGREINRLKQLAKKQALLEGVSDGASTSGSDDEEAFTLVKGKSLASKYKKVKAKYTTLKERLNEPISPPIARRKSKKVPEPDSEESDDSEEEPEPKPKSKKKKKVVLESPADAESTPAPAPKPVPEPAQKPVPTPSPEVAPVTKPKRVLLNLGL